MDEKLIPVADKNQPGRRYTILLIVIAVVVILDQWAKWLVRKNIPINTTWLPESLGWLSPYARITYIQNKGASFGMFQNGNVIIIVLAFLVIGAVFYYVFTMESQNVWMLAAAGLYAGGALGNLVDRLTIGSVTDFISVGTFYIFNIADASINVSVAMLLLIFWVHERRRPDEMIPKTGEKS